MNRIAFVMLMPLLMSLLVGCQPQTTSSTSTTSPNESDAAGPGGTSGTSGSQDAVSLEIKSWDQVQQLVASQQGKVVVVDVWSTSCTPCMREFPHLVQLHNDYDQGLFCISFSVDYIGGSKPPEEYRPQVLDFLRSQKSTLHNVLSSDPDGDVFSKLKISSIPAVLVYDQQGNLARTFSNDNNEYGDEGFTYPAHIRPLIEQLLKG